MATIIISLLIACGVIFGIYRMIKTKNEGCCSTGESVKTVNVNDKDKSHYPYSTKFQCSDMICENCSKKVANTLNSLEDTYATVNLSKKEVTVLTKQQPNIVHLQQLLSQAGYPAKVIS